MASYFSLPMKSFLAKKSNQKKRHPDQFALRVPEAFSFAYGPS